MKVSIAMETYDGAKHLREQLDSFIGPRPRPDEAIVCDDGSWFRDTLPTAPVDRLAVARLDGDPHESTTDALVALDPKLSVGGYLIVDDYVAIPACRQAVEDYRRRHAVTEPLVEIDWTGVFWRRER
jgi:hypothetical protein